MVSADRAVQGEFLYYAKGLELEYLFGDLRGLWAGEELSQALGSATKKHLGVYLRASG